MPELAGVLVGAMVTLLVFEGTRHHHAKKKPEKRGVTLTLMGTPGGGTVHATFKHRGHKPEHGHKHGG